ncbi:MAG: HAMP domain-containing sensor histidine kinase [Flavobacteriales bacterium]|nr:HAMP domain-containing sensor histidine kinase [Flavobacteriales bacterium]
MNPKSTNRVLVYTLIAITLIAVYMTVNSYYTQVALYEEKEMFKLDCIANAVAYKISGEEHKQLVEAYPKAEQAASARADSSYRKIHDQMSMAKKMTGVPSEMYTVVRDTNIGAKNFYLAIATDNPNWLSELNGNEERLDTMYAKGGMLGRFEKNGETWMGALSPVMDANGNAAGVLSVEETFSSFMAKARDQIYINIIISLAFILIVGSLVFYSVRDILARQQRLALERLEVENMRHELIANVSHDLRTPLASIHGYIETLLMKRDELDKEQMTKYLNTTLQSADKLRTLVDELFDLSKLESKERKLNIESFSVSEIVYDVTNNFRIAAQEKGVEIIHDLPTHLPNVKADLGLIDRVLQNLISNSLRFSSTGQNITLKVEQNGRRLWLHVDDQGSGITDEELPHIFNRYHKGKTSKTGSGLGLAIVKGILDLHKSEYKVESKVNEGTRFSFSLDIA